MTDTEALLGVFLFIVAFWAFAATMHLIDAKANCVRLDKLHKGAVQQVEHWKARSRFWQINFRKVQAAYSQTLEQ